MSPERCNSGAGSGDWTLGPEKILEKDPDKIIKSIMEQRKKAPALVNSTIFFTSL